MTYENLLEKYSDGPLTECLLTLDGINYGQGEKINEQQKATVVLAAICYHDEEMEDPIGCAKKEIEKGADVNCSVIARWDKSNNSNSVRPNGTPLTLVGKIDLAQLLIDNGADVNKAHIGENGDVLWTPLGSARKDKRQELVDFLENKGAL